MDEDKFETFIKYIHKRVSVTPITITSGVYCGMKYNIDILRNHVMINISEKGYYEYNDLNDYYWKELTKKKIYMWAIKNIRGVGTFNES